MKKLDEECFVDVGIEALEEVDKALQNMSNTAEDDGIKQSALEKLTKFVTEYKDIFRIRLRNDPSSQIQHMLVKLYPKFVPANAQSRRYSEPQMKFTGAYFESPFVSPDRIGIWAAAPLLVPKPAPTYFRLTLDLRSVNSTIVAVPWYIPYIDFKLPDLAEKRLCIAVLAATSCRIFTDILQFFDAIRKPTRTLQARKNSVANLILQHFFTICRKLILYISALNSLVFAALIHFCGWIIDDDCVRFDPRHLSGLVDVNSWFLHSELTQALQPIHSGLDL